MGERFDFQIPVPQRDVADGYTVTSLALSRRFAWARYSTYSKMCGRARKRPKKTKAAPKKAASSKKATAQP